MASVDHGPNDWEMPSWFGRPAGETGALVPLNRLLYRDSDTALTIGDVFAYSSGFGYHLGVFRRAEDIADPRDLKQQLDGATGSALTLAIEYADGRRASNQDRFRDSRPPGIYLAVGGDGGSGTSMRLHHWVWPLPSPGVVSFTVSWPTRGIPETRIDLDATPILDASERSLRPWHAAESDRHKG
jgi:hypothetical protein